MKRPMTLTALILSLSVQSIFSIMLTIILFNIEVAFEPHKWTALYIFVGVLLACALSCIIFSALSIRTWKKSPEQYKKSWNVLIADIISTFASLGGAIVLCFLRFVALMMFLFVLTIIVDIACITLLIIDLSLNEKKLQMEGIMVENNSNTTKVSLDVQLSKLQSMKERGLINEEEYESLRKLHIKEAVIKNEEIRPKSQLEIKLDKLNDMKARGLINEDDYKKIKAIYIKQSL